MGKKKQESEAVDARTANDIEDRERIRTIRSAAVELEIPREMVDHMVVQGVSVEEASSLFSEYKTRGFARRGPVEWGEARDA